MVLSDGGPEVAEEIPSLLRRQRDGHSWPVEVWLQRFRTTISQHFEGCKANCKDKNKRINLQTCWCGCAPCDPGEPPNEVSQVGVRQSEGIRTSRILPEVI